MVKTITITDEAYGALKREKRLEESFTQVISRLTKAEKTLADYLGLLGTGDSSELQAAA